LARLALGLLKVAKSSSPILLMTRTAIYIMTTNKLQARERKVRLSLPKTPGSPYYMSKANY
jgi:hypothetical protein